MINLLVFTRETEAGSAEIGIRMRLLYLLVIVGTLAATTGSASYLIRRSMILLSFRYEGDFVIALHKSAFEQVAAIAHSAQIPVCASPFAGDTWMLQDVTLVWHGIGATSYLKLTSSGKSVLIPVTSIDVDPIRIKPKPSGKCDPPKMAS